MKRLMRMSDSKSKQEEDNIVPTGEDNYKTDDSDSEEEGNCTGDDIGTELNGSDKQVEWTLGRKDQDTADQCQERSPIGLNQRQSSLGTESEEKTDNRRQKEEHASVLNEKEDKIHSLETNMWRQKKEHDSILKQKEDEIKSLGTKMRKTKEEHASILKYKETEFNSLKTKMSLESSSYLFYLDEDAKKETTMSSMISEMKDTITQLNNCIEDQGSSIATLNSQLSEKAKILEDNEKRIRELEIDSKRFQTAADATKSSSASRIASLELEQAKEFERERQDYWRKWEEIERNHSQELMKRETNATEILEGYEREIDTQRKESKAMEEKYKQEVHNLKKEVDVLKKEVESISKKKSDLVSDTKDTITQLNNCIKDQGSSIATLNSQLSEKAKLLQDNEKRIRELEIDSKRFQTATDATKSSSASRIASLELERAKECERERQDYWRKWEEMEKKPCQELMKSETNVTEIVEEYQRENDTQRKERKAMEEKYKNEVQNLKKEVESISKKKSDLESEKQNRKATIRELEWKNTALSKYIKKAGETNRQLTLKIENHEKILTAMTKSFDLSQAEAKALKQANDSLEQYLQQREEMYRQETENLNTEIRRLTLRRTTLH